MLRGLLKYLVGASCGFIIGVVACNYKTKEESADVLFPPMPGLIATFQSIRDLTTSCAVFVKSNDLDPKGEGREKYDSMARGYNAEIEFFIASMDIGWGPAQGNELLQLNGRASTAASAFVEWYDKLDKRPKRKEGWRGGWGGGSTTSYSPLEAVTKAAEIVVDIQKNKREARNAKVERLTTSLSLCKWKMWSEL
jgi:hypothetical protein